MLPQNYSLIITTSRTGHHPSRNVSFLLSTMYINGSSWRGCLSWWSIGIRASLSFRWSFIHSLILLLFSRTLNNWKILSVLHSLVHFWGYISMSVEGSRKLSQNFTSKCWDYRSSQNSSLVGVNFQVKWWWSRVLNKRIPRSSMLTFKHYLPKYIYYKFHIRHLYVMVIYENFRVPCIVFNGPSTVQGSDSAS